MENKFNISLAYNYAESRKLTEVEVQEFVKEFKATAENADLRKAFAEKLSVPVLKSIEPQSSVRNIFMVDNVPAGALPEYPVDMSDIEDAVVMPRFGAVPQNIVVGDILTVPTFEIANSVEWKLSFARDGRYNIVERALEKLAASFVRAEEKAGWDTIRGSIDASNTLVTTETYLSKTLFNDLITEMRAVNGYDPNVVYVSPRRAKDIRNWANTEIDPVTQREIFKAGGMGNIWNVEIRELRTLLDDEIFLFDTSKLGVMPVRTSLQTFDDPTAIKKLRAGVGAWEEVGFAVIDKKAVFYVNLP